MPVATKPIVAGSGVTVAFPANAGTAAIASKKSALPSRFMTQPLVEGLARST
jgi:hypothetical protein